MTAALLWLSLLLGLRHALDADHMTTVLALSSQRIAPRSAANIAAAWGLGHGLVLLLAGLAVAFLGVRFPASFDRWIETAAGVLLLLLGIDSLRRLSSQLPFEQHGTAFNQSRTTARALFFGCVHGLEGSGALAILALPALRSSVEVFAYLVLFGLGTLTGMVLCSLAVVWPFAVTVRSVAGARAVSRVMGGASVAMGSWLAVRASL